MNLMLSQPPIVVSNNVAPTAAFDPPVIRPGEEAIYRITFDALEESVEMPAKIKTPPALELRPGAHGQMFEMGSAGLQPRTTFNYRVRVSGQGVLTIPEFSVNVYGKAAMVPAATLEITNASSAAASSAQRLVLELETTNVFVGQPVKARVVQPSTPGALLPALGQVQVTGDSILVDPAAMRSRSSGGGMVLSEMLVTPIATGRIPVIAQAFALGVRSFGPGPVVLRGPVIVPAQGTLIDSDPVELRVRPLPREGELPGFTGAIGLFSVDRPELERTSLRVGEPVRLTVKIRGDEDGNLARLVAPPAPASSDWQILAPTAPEPVPPQFLQVRGFATFTYTLVPLNVKATATPAIPFSCFDPVRETYVDLTIAPVPVSVVAGAVAGDSAPLIQAGALGAGVEKEPVLSGLAVAPGLSASSLIPLQQRVWFPLVQLVPAAGFLGLWAWDRRRRFYEQHPDVLLRRRARRALHREWRAVRRAARAGDGTRFAATATSAMRVACSPHYPAVPRALVGSDVLAVLPEQDRAGRTGEVVRRFFSVTDATRFGSAFGVPALAGQAPNGESDLLALRPELDRVLEQLEARL